MRAGAGISRQADSHLPVRRWPLVRIHANFPHHRDGVLRLLGCRHDAEAVSRALQSWDAFGFEDAAAAAGMVVTAMRSFDEWDAHPQGKAVAGLPLLSIERIGDAPPLPLPPAARPLSGVRVLDLTRVIAGPVCGRTLAGHGADVLLVTGPHLPSIEPLVMETGPGKRACSLDLRNPPGRQALDALLGEADVLVQGYRPGSLDALGLDAAGAARSGPAWSTSACAPTARPGHGPRGAASTRWCRPPAASTMPRRGPAATARPRPCRRRRWTAPPAI